jgi:hypothetical protein
VLRLMVERREFFYPPEHKARERWASCYKDSAND